MSAEELHALVAPCGHLLMRPTGGSVVHHCNCGRSWRITKDGGGAWDAVEIPRGSA